MTVLYDDAFGLDSDRVHDSPSLPSLIRRRWSGRYALDPFGLDPQLSDAVAPLLRSIVRVDVSGAEHIPQIGPAVLMMNRGVGIVEPTALSVAVLRATGRRVRVTGAPMLPLLGTALRRFGAISSTADDVHMALSAGHLVIVPMAQTWLGGGAGTPPLELLQSIMEFAVIPVGVRPGGPLGTTIAPWRVRVGAPVQLEVDAPIGDPLGAAELGEAVRRAVDTLL